MQFEFISAVWKNTTLFLKNILETFPYFYLWILFPEENNVETDTVTKILILAL